MRATRFRPALFPAVLALLAAFAVAGRAAMTPFEVNMDRVKVSHFGGSLGSATTFIIPTVSLMITSHGDVWAQSRNGEANAQARAKFYVSGLKKEVVQGLARQVQDDLVAKLRAAGYTVLTYDDVKSNAEIAGHGRDAPDSKWGLPTNTKDSLTYVIATPTDAQAFDRPINGPVWWMRNVAKEKGAVILVPEITFTVPQVYGEKEVGYKRAAANIVLKPAMMLQGAMIWGIDAKGGSSNIQVQQHGKRLAAEVAGTAKMLSEDKTEFSRAWQRSSADYLFTLDQAAFSDGVLRVGYALNSMTVDQIKKAHK